MIYDLGHREVNDVKDFQEAQNKLVKGNRYKIRIIRDKKHSSVHLNYDFAATAMGAALTQQAQAQTAQLGWMGLGLQDVDQMMQKRFALASSKGVVVSFVENNSPAALANFQQGDVITDIDGRTIRDTRDLQKAFSKKKPGDVVSVTIVRMGQKFATEVNLSNAPILTIDPPTLPEATVETEASWIGLGLEPMSPAEAQEMNLPESTKGMVVNAVNNGPAAKTGILIGDIIIGINGKPIIGLQAFNAATNDANGALLDVIRSGKHIYISVPPPQDPALKGNQKNKLYQVAFQQKRFSQKQVYRDIAIASYTDDLMGQVYPNFENAPYFIIYDINNRTFEVINNPALRKMDVNNKRFVVAHLLVDRGVGSIIAGNIDKDITAIVSEQNIGVYSGVFGNTNNMITMYLGSKLVKSN